MQPYIQLLQSSAHGELSAPDSESALLVGTDEQDLEQALAQSPAWIKSFPPTVRFHWLRRILRLQRPQWLRVRSKLHTVGLSLLPSYISDRLRGRKPGAKVLSDTACLDGLRGLACLIVINQHLSYNYSQAFLDGWNGTENRAWVIQLPFIRILWSGHTMVYIFFAISGYVLSYKPLKQMHIDSKDQALRTINSSILRRGIRLFLPTFIATFSCMLLIQAGLFENGRKAFEDGSSLVSANEPPPPRFETFSEQFWHWWETAFLEMLYPWTWEKTWQDYDPHLWTIPTEFRCSMLLFLIQCGVARLRHRSRLVVLAALVFYCVFTDAGHPFLFIAGMFMAQTDLLLRERTSWPWHVLARDNWGPIRHLYRVISFLTFVAGLFLSSTPTLKGEDSQGYSYLLNNLTPSWYSNASFFWQSVGSILLVWSVCHSQDVQLLFTNSFTQYLGKTSYALYIVHGNILRSVLYASMPTVRRLCGDVENSNPRFVMAWLMGACLIMPIVFWTADIFWRMVDVPSVKFSRWFEGRVSVQGS